MAARLQEIKLDYEEVRLAVGETFKINYHLIPDILEEETINWNYDFDPLYGVYTYDSEDENIINKIKVSVVLILRSLELIL